MIQFIMSAFFGLGLKKFIGLAKCIDRSKSDTPAIRKDASVTTIFLILSLPVKRSRNPVRIGNNIRKAIKFT